MERDGAIDVRNLSLNIVLMSGRLTGNVRSFLPGALCIDRIWNLVASLRSRNVQVAGVVGGAICGYLSRHRRHQRVGDSIESTKLNADNCLEQSVHEQKLDLVLYRPVGLQINA